VFRVLGVSHGLKEILVAGYSSTSSGGQARAPARQTGIGLLPAAEGFFLSRACAASNRRSRSCTQIATSPVRHYIPQFVLAFALRPVCSNVLLAGRAVTFSLDPELVEVHVECHLHLVDPDESCQSSGHRHREAFL